MTDIPKNVRDTITTLRQQGHDIGNTVEAFLVHHDDWIQICDLLATANDYSSGKYASHPPDANGETRRYGVKIIESQHIPKGTIFKVFKNDQLENLGYPNYELCPRWPEFAKTEPHPLEISTVTATQEEKKSEKKYSTKRRIELDE